MDPVLLTIILIVTFLYLCTCIYTVPQRREALITSFGKYVRTQFNAGLNVKYPWPFNIVAARIPTDLRQVTEMLDTKTKDNLFVSLPITIQYEVTDTARYFFDTDHPVHQMSKIVSASVRKYTSGKDFQELYDERDEISEAVISDVKTQILEYGINIRRIVVDEPTVPQDVQDAYNHVRASERQKDAAQNEAAADYIRRVKAAEADKERNILIGQGVAGFRKSIAEGYAGIRNELILQGVDPVAADRFMEEAMRLDTMRDIGDKGNMVIVIPSESKSHWISDIVTAAPVLDKIREQKAKAAKPGV
jgi:regulator of protease activity HflC (stomatin/prohibitin superfamily)